MRPASLTELEGAVRRSEPDRLACPVHNCDVMIREDIDEDQFIDILIGNRKYVPCLYVRPTSSSSA